MFESKEVEDMLSKFSEDENDRLKYINNKVKKYEPLRISLSELNYLYYRIDGTMNYYNINNLKELLRSKGIGYTSIIKNLGIAKSTLSKLLNADRNVRLDYLNDFIKSLNAKYNLTITKEFLKGK